MLIDDFLPDYDTTIVEHQLIEAPIDDVFRAVREMDFLDIDLPVVTALMSLRDLPNRVRARLGTEPPSEPPATMRLADLFDRPDQSPMVGWVGLGEQKPDEIVFGAVGKVWKPDIEWRTVPPTEFARFDEPGWAKIAAGFSFRRYGPTRILVSYEARTAGTDDQASAWFGRYWRLVRVFVGVVMRGAVRHVKKVAESGWSGADTGP